FNMFTATSGWAWKGVSQLYRTDDGGATWTEIHLRGTISVVGAAYRSEQEAWLVGVPDADLKQAVFHTVDGGQTWQQLPQLSGPNISLYFLDEQNGWALNGIAAAGNIFYQVFRTFDGGASWQQVLPASRGEAGQDPMSGTIHLATGDSISFSLPNTIWLASGAGISAAHVPLTVSWNGGQTWRDINPPLPGDAGTSQPVITASAPQFAAEGRAYLPATVGNKLLFSSSNDGGNTWAPLAPMLPSQQATPRVQFVDKDDGFAVCGSNLCSTHDGALTWDVIQTPFPFQPAGSSAYVTQFDFVDKLTGWALLVGADGSSTLLHTTDGGLTWINLKPRLGF
ncbi:MAG: WD40/YVTN/BNR-like repeat-containing protein, partial [Anaerolineae bacterium]